MKTEIRKILADKTETLEDGRVVIVPDFSQLDDLVDDLNTLFSLYIVSQGTELLPDFLYKDTYGTKIGFHGDKEVSEEWNNYLKKLGNCG
jgi:hypothetical protein